MVYISNTEGTDAHPNLDYRLLVSGAHLDGNFGETKEEIQKDGFSICSEIKIDMGEDSMTPPTTAIGSAVLSITRH